MPRIGGQAVPPKTMFLISTEGLLILLGLVGATFLRFLDWQSGWKHIFSEHALARFVMVAVVCQISMYYHDLYDLQFVRRRATFFVQLLQAFGVASLFLGLCFYLRPDFSPGRGITLLAAPIVVALICGWRMLVHSSGFSPGGRERVLIMGTGEQGISLAREIISRPEFNLDIIGFLDEKGENIGKSLFNPKVIGATSEVEEIAAREKPDRIVLSLKERRGATPVRELLHLRFSGVAVEDAHSVCERVTGRIMLDRISPSALILSEGFRKSRFLSATKRILDLFMSALLLTVFSPAIAAVALAIWLEDGSPVLFRQPRIGLSGHTFEVLKFRSMSVDPTAQPSWTADGDKRITRVGRFIRKFRLDELPQLWNVLRGEMSLVGPRPEQPYFCELLEKEIPFFGLRHSVRPGVTGWAQIKYPYGASVEDARRKLELDLFYVKHLSLSLDLAIIFETVKVVLLGRGAK